MTNLKVALVHHWLVTMRGGERVIEALTEMFPQADIFTLVSDPSNLSPQLRKLRMRSSFLQRFPNRSRWYPYYLPLFPLAISQVDLSGYDLVISSDAAIAKGVRTRPDAVHICYCHTPMRCIWGPQQNYHSSAAPGVRLGLRAVREPLCRWDFKAAQRVTHFVANSYDVQARIRRCYRRDSTVIYPPVRTDAFLNHTPSVRSGDFYLLVSQLVPYKRVDLVVEAFSRTGQPLIVIGEGPQRSHLERIAASNVCFWGYQPQQVVLEAMQRCAAFVFAGQEDFGIVLAEAQACGKPVIAYRHGGAGEIVREGVTGILFEEQTVDAIIDSVNRFDPTAFDAGLIRALSLRFSKSRFMEEFLSFVIRAVDNGTGGRSSYA